MENILRVGKFLALLICLIQSTALFAAAAPARFEVGEFSFTRPEAWKWIEVTSPMRKAQLQVPDAKAGQPPTEVIFFYFGAGQGGNVESNVSRWFQQFEGTREQIQAKTDSVTVGGRKVTYVHAQGTYMSGMPGGPKTPLKDHALLGAIVESDKGNVFIRMTGPIETVKKAEPDFKKMVESGLK